MTNDDSEPPDSYDNSKKIGAIRVLNKYKSNKNG
tara:strand:- start:678 stop:779 length:102 start_codon:yes stop_codon:yes gene_type:complete